MWTASIRADSSPPDSVVGDSVDAHFFLQPEQLLDDSLGGGTDVKRAMSMLRMGRDDQAMKKAMGMLRMGRAPAARRAMGMLRMGRSFTDSADEQTSKRAMSMLRMGRAMGMLRMGRPYAEAVGLPVASRNDKRGMPMLRMG